MASLLRSILATPELTSTTFGEVSWVPSGNTEVTTPFCSHGGGPASSALTILVGAVPEGNQRRSGTRCCNDGSRKYSVCGLNTFGKVPSESTIPLGASLIRHCSPSFRSV